MAKWSKEELNYLQDSWGTVSIASIAKRLGRSINAVKCKGYRTGLTDARFMSEYVTLNQLAIALKVDWQTLNNIRITLGLPTKNKVFAIKEKTLVLDIEKFWKWCEKNHRAFDWTRVEVNSLGPEPDWMPEARTAAYYRAQVNKTIATANAKWTKNDDTQLIRLLNQFKYTYPEIAVELRRTQGAVKRRIRDLKLKQRPVRLPNHIVYSDSDVEKLLDLYERGYPFEYIGGKLGKSALGVRGKMERMGYQFIYGVATIDV